MEENDKTKKKKLPLAVKLLLLPFELVLVLLIVVLLWFTFSYFDRIKPVDALPPDYALYLRTDSVWGTAEPLLDLDATLIAMTSPNLQKYREDYLNIKSSKLRQNFFVKKALQRRFDAAVYGGEGDGSDSGGGAGSGAGSASGVIGVLDTGFLAGASRLAPHFIPHIKALSQKLELSVNRHGNYYQFGDSLFFVFRKNLVVLSTDKALLEAAMTWSNSELYQKEELEAVNARLKDPLRIFANGKNLLNFVVSSQKSDQTAGQTTGQSSDQTAVQSDGKKSSSLLQNYLEIIVPYLSQEEYTTLHVGITESDLNVTISVPMDFGDNPSVYHPVLGLLQKDSAVPSLLPQFSEDVQYYTLISAGTLRDLRDAATRILPAEKDFMTTWNRSDTISKFLFNRSLDDLLFSWTADEFAVFGIEGKSEPVFGIKIADESKRREIFDRVFSSYIINSNDSLLVDGVRLPRVEMPGFVLSVLQALNINIPKPYYLVKDNYIYLSQSPENLAAINSGVQSSKKLTGSENWKRVSSKQSPYSTLSLYYNLERSVPFFIKGNSAMSKILALYNSGRFDLRIKDNLLTVQLQASAVALESSNHIPGFPLELEHRTNALLVKSNAKRSKLVFWLENNTSVNSLDCGTFERGSAEYPDLQYIAAASEATSRVNGGELWAVTKNGMAYLLNGKLESVFGYPILSGVSLSCQPFVYKDSLVLVGADGAMCLISEKGELSQLETGVESGILAAPCVSGDYMAFYEKGFFGGIHIYKGQENITAEGPLELDGIAYGSPCIFTAGGKQYVSMITQAGQLYVYDFDGQLLAPFPVGLNGVFYLNVVMADGYLFALSEEGDLYRVGLDGKAMRVKIPYFTAKSGHITVYDYDEKAGQEIFVSGEGNSLYGFNSQMELLPNFPVSAYGNPLFIDLNGDNKNDCLAITFDNKIIAANVLR